MDDMSPLPQLRREAKEDVFQFESKTYFNSCSYFVNFHLKPYTCTQTTIFTFGCVRFTSEGKPVL